MNKARHKKRLDRLNGHVTQNKPVPAESLEFEIEFLTVLAARV